jgi:predicted enzyme related to lactoylglutathione lyase
VITFNSKHNRAVRFDIPVADLDRAAAKEPVHSIGPHGFRALVLDTAGNRIALHSHADA